MLSAPHSHVGAIRRRIQSSDDPRNRFLGTWDLDKLNSECCPWFIQEGKVTVNYNADGDLILHTTATVGLPQRRLKRISKAVDGGFARVDEHGIYRCAHTPKNSHWKIQIVPQQQQPAADTSDSSESCAANCSGSIVGGVGAELDMMEFRNGKITKNFRFRRTSTATL